MDTLLRRLPAAICQCQARAGGCWPSGNFGFAPEGFSALVAKGDTFAGVPIESRRPLTAPWMGTSPWRLRRCCAAKLQQLGKPCRSCSISWSCR